MRKCNICGKHYDARMVTHLCPMNSGTADSAHVEQATTDPDVVEVVEVALAELIGQPAASGSAPYQFVANHSTQWLRALVERCRVAEAALSRAYCAMANDQVVPVDDALDLQTRLEQAEAELAIYKPRVSIDCDGTR